MHISHPFISPRPEEDLPHVASRARPRSLADKDPPPLVD